MSNKKYTIEQVKEIYLIHGFKFENTNYENNKIAYPAKCIKHNHNCKINLNNVISNQDCNKCSYIKRGEKRKFDIKQVKEIYKKHNLEFLDDNYIHSHFKHLVKCLKCYYGSNNEWKICLHSVQQGRGCPKCAKNLKYTTEQCVELCHKRNIEILCYDFKNVETYYPAKCLICNHGTVRKWKICLRDILSNHGCPKCAGKLQYTTNEFVAICLKNNIEILCENYKNARTNYPAKCLICGYGTKENWKVRLNNVQNNHGCPNCSKG